MGGGAMMDMGVYPLQAARYVSGEEPISVSAQSFTNRPELFSEVDDTTTFQLKFPSGAVASLITSFDMSVNYMSAVAQQGWFKLEPFSSYSGIKGRSSQGPISFPQINQQAAQMDEVSRCIQDGKPMRVPGEEGLRDIRVVEAIYRSIEEDGQTIMI
jgi:glucose-fructose oxidoreductase